MKGSTIALDKGVLPQDQQVQSQNMLFLFSGGKYDRSGQYQKWILLDLELEHWKVPLYSPNIRAKDKEVYEY